jgi:hypothetical protein
MDVNWDDSFLMFAWKQLLGDEDFLAAMADMEATAFLAEYPDFGKPK